MELMLSVTIHAKNCNGSLLRICSGIPFVVCQMHSSHEPLHLTKHFHPSPPHFPPKKNKMISLSVSESTSVLIFQPLQPQLVSLPGPTEKIAGALWSLVGNTVNSHAQPPQLRLAVNAESASLGADERVAIEPRSNPA